METNNHSYKIVLILLVQLVVISCAKNNFQLGVERKSPENKIHYENFFVTFHIRDSHTFLNLTDVTIVLNKNKEFISDKNGEFKYYAKKGDILVFKMKGYETHEATIENDQYLNYLIVIDLKKIPIIRNIP
ncbi:hypothetical protein [Flavobacterium sp.]|uniref:hypothetical protein n=1 Tax=Flavobacterium sp. TaxID=239 RepID=UPI002623D335|nr:hypothetical protein [Flavobacterium sp.]